MSHYEPPTQTSDSKIPPPQMPSRFNLYESENTEPGIPTLQREMGLMDDPDLFSDTLANIREIWRQHGVDRNVSYKLQDPETMVMVKERALNEMPFLRERYDDGWPVTIYLERSLQNRMTVAAQRALDEGPYKFTGRRFAVVNPEDVKDKLRSSCYPEPCPTGGTEHTMNSETRKPATCRREDGVLSPLTIRPAHLEGYRGAIPTSPFPFGANMSSVSTPPTSPAPVCGIPSTPSTSWSFSPSSQVGFVLPSSPRSFGHSSPKSESQTDHESIMDLLRSYSLPLEDAEHITDLLAASGVSNMAYMRVLAHMSSTREWLREQRDEGGLTDVQMRLLREILEHLAGE